MEQQQHGFAAVSAYEIEPAELVGADDDDLSDREFAAIAAAIYRARQRRGRLFRADLFSEPAWDMLLDLAINKALGRRVSSLSLCLAARTPATTGLRWIARLEGYGMLRREHDPTDRRLTMVEITPYAYGLMRRFVVEEVRGAERRPRLI